ncbi:MAG: hypothetical protein QNJ37_14405 [Crocosphaera sp.]|nr:hypothetical protein [Crocosphaera sp.]
MEQNSISTLIPYIIIALIPGIINAVNACIKFEEKYLSYIFFKPLKTFPFWGWLLIQIYVPAQIYWWILILIFPEKPDINEKFILMVIIYGICFHPLLKYIEEQALISRNLSIILNWVDNLLEYYVQATQLEKTSTFWNDLEKEIEKIQDLSPALKYLKTYYFSQKFANINKEKYQYFKNKLEEIAQNNNTEELIATCLKGKIPRRDLPNVLKQFNVSDEFINKYFKQS